jgi:hypothetical protein
MMRKALVSALAVGAALCCAPARAEDNPACAKFQEPLAYNACLARFGPRAHGVRAIASPDGDGGGAGSDSAPADSAARPLVHQRRGRAHVEFDVGGARR